MLYSIIIIIREALEAFHTKKRNIQGEILIALIWLLHIVYKTHISTLSLIHTYNDYE